MKIEEAHRRARLYANLLQHVQSFISDDYSAAMITLEVIQDLRLEKFRDGDGATIDEPASEKQKSLLKMLGIEFEKGVSKRVAARLIEDFTEAD